MSDDGFWIEPPDEPSGTPDSAATETAALPIQRESAPEIAPESELAQEQEQQQEQAPAAAPGSQPEPGPASERAPEPDLERVPEPEAQRVPEFEAQRVPEHAPEPTPAPGPTPAPVPASDPALLKPQLEAVLMVVENPVPDVVLAQVLEQPTEAVVTALRELSEEYTAQNRGFDLRQVAGGWRFYTRPEHAEAVEKFVLDGQQSKLTQAALETLAVVAYRQPVSRSRISAVRGVNCDGVMRTLLARGLVEEYGVEPETGAFLYRTTDFFMERMGLVSLDELPELAPFLPEVEALEAETEGGLEGFPLGAGKPGGTAAGAASSGEPGNEPDVAREAEADAGTEAEPEAEADTGAEAGAEVDAKTEAEADTDPEAEGDTEADSDPVDTHPAESPEHPVPTPSDAPSATDPGPVSSEPGETGDTGGEDPAAADAEDSAHGAPADPVPAADDPTDTGSGSASAVEPDAADATDPTTTDD